MITKIAMKALAVVLLFITSLTFNAFAQDKALTPASVIEDSSTADWRTPTQANLLYLELRQGMVVFELASDFAPGHIANLTTLVSDKYFDGLAIIRSQDNYVVQWGDPTEQAEQAKSLGDAKTELAPEFTRPLIGINFNAIDSRDAYADHIGFSNGFSVAHDNENAWLTHCYGALGAGRGLKADSGNAAQLYVVTGHAPRHLDKNVSLLGRAIHGMEHLSSLARGTGPLGFYETKAERVEIKSVRFGTDLEPSERISFQIMRTDTDTFAEYVTSRTFRKNEWFVDETGHIEVCNVGIPVRVNK